jgi:hypothetical protein
MSNLLTWALVGGGAYWLYKSKKGEAAAAAESAKTAVTEVVDTVQSSIPQTLFGLHGLGTPVEMPVGQVSWFSKATTLPVVGSVANGTMLALGGAAAVGAYLLATRKSVSLGKCG